MSGAQTEAAPAPLRLVSLVVAEVGRLALVLGHRDRWLPQAGYTFVPLELPAGPAEPGATTAEMVDRVARRWLGQPVRRLPSRWTYGPSAAHAIDRVAAAQTDKLAPLLRLERMLPVETPSGPGLRSVLLCTYRAALDGCARPNNASAGMLWLTASALRQAVRGLPLGDLLALGDVSAHFVEPREALAEAFVYVPADYGERYLLRAVAKYGQQAIFPEG